MSEKSVAVQGTRMGARAIIERWEMTQEQRSQVIAELYKTVTSGTAKPREKISAAKALMVADRINIEEAAVAKMPDHSEAAKDDQFTRAIGIINRIGNRSDDDRGEGSDPGGCVDGVVRSSKTERPPDDETLPNGGAD